MVFECYFFITSSCIVIDVVYGTPKASKRVLGKNAIVCIARRDVLIDALTSVFSNRSSHIDVLRSMFTNRCSEVDVPNRRSEIDVPKSMFRIDGLKSMFRNRV